MRDAILSNFEESSKTISAEQMSVRTVEERERKKTWQQFLQNEFLNSTRVKSWTSLPARGHFCHPSASQIVPHGS